MISVLLFGLLLGMRHAVEADHVAAVASLATRSTTPGEAARLGIAWGIGHTVTLFIIGSGILLLGAVVPETAVNVLELAVGVMLIGLGIDVVRRFLKHGLHIHAHQHNGARHIHVHAHEGQVEGQTAARKTPDHAMAAQVPHAAQPHRHPHPRMFPLRALLVGLVHGMAGSAALVLLTLGAIDSPWHGVAYIALFGIGSIAGMALLSVMISLPLRFTAHKLGAVYNSLTVAIGVLTVCLGGSIVWEKIGAVNGLLS